MLILVSTEQWSGGVCDVGTLHMLILVSTEHIEQTQ